MTSLHGRAVQLTRYPDGAITPECFEVVDVEVPSPRAGQVVVRNSWTSVDPGLLLRMSARAPAGYFAAFPLGRPLDGILTIGEVLESRHEGFDVGDTVWHASGWRELSVVDADVEQLGGLGTLTKLDVSESEPQWYLGPLGGMGLTAYAGLHVVAALRGGDTVWVSAGAGAVGSLAAQIARNVGNTVLVSTGSPHKVAWLREELGFDLAMDYRARPLRDSLAELAPSGLDVYFDSVGGDHLEAALDAMRRGGRIALCGSISEYQTDPRGPGNLFLAVSKELTLRGFRGSGNLGLLPEVRRRLGGWLRAGSLVWRETVFDGLANAPLALGEMAAGRTIGKTLVRL
ncbi:NADP-dependent oxidoreductase [Actinophytocola sp.]|uniref:NADP-dependent oxidoreductase n=1 Tax=Actinophytocola sp. TaxID=1872138 RepID=UPI002ED377B9